MIKNYFFLRFVFSLRTQRKWRVENKFVGISPNIFNLLVHFAGNKLSKFSFLLIFFSIPSNFYCVRSTLFRSFFNIQFKFMSQTPGLEYFHVSQKSEREREQKNNNKKVLKLEFLYAQQSKND